MRRENSSITAQGIAAIRAIESSKPQEERICYDPLARQLVSPFFYTISRLFAGYGEWRAPGTFGFVVARCRYIDDYLKGCLESGIEQLVILGAGMDSRAYRFNEMTNEIKVFEVDHPATQQVKRRKLELVLGQTPKQVVFVPIDFDDETIEKLFEYGYSSQLKTCFIWEGVTYYLKPEAVEGTLKFVVNNSTVGSSIIFDYVYRSALTAAHKRGEIARMQRYARFTGEMLNFGIEEGEAVEYLRKLGFTKIQNATSANLRKIYFTGLNRNRTIAPIYAIIYAEVGE